MLFGNFGVTFNDFGITFNDIVRMKALMIITYFSVVIRKE
jgi:hypothetical protein